MQRFGTQSKRSDPGCGTASGKDRLPSGKAVYLTHVTDVFRRTVTATYADELWSSASDAAPREYADPHRATSSNEPNAYQDCYATKYLDKLVMASPTGLRLSAFDFVTLRAQRCRDRNGQSQTLIRTLDDFRATRQALSHQHRDREQRRHGPARISIRLSFGSVTNRCAARRSANAHVSPRRTAWSGYQQQDLVQCNRTVTVPQPTQTPSGAPRVFYGDNYVVTLWFDPTGNVITLQIWSWSGRWVSSQPTAGIDLTTGMFNGTAVDVIATSQDFAVTFDSGSDSVAYIFNKAAGYPGQFVQATIDSA